MKIYTKTGDDGTTGLQGASRISKANPRILAYGAIDEINSSLGIVLSTTLDDDIKDILTKIQNDLFVAGADLSNPDTSSTKNRITTKMVQHLEQKIDQFEGELAPITKFILPGGHVISSQVHLARAIARRAETLVVLLSEKENVNVECKKYLNRLSDLLFVIARLINKRNGVTDVFWKP